MTVISDTQLANIIFNETRSLSGVDIDKARVNIAHAILNAAASKHKFPMMAPATAKPGSGEQAIFGLCCVAVGIARTNIAAGKDPTNGAEHFNFRKNNSQSDFQGHKIKTSVGPLNNSYPTAELPAIGIYANTYE